MALTNIADTIYNADGSKYAGSLLITISGPVLASDGHVVAPTGPIKVSIVNGVLNINLEPNDTAIPAGSYYSVEYQPESFAAGTVRWVVPTSGSPVGLSVVQTGL